ncbi:DUF3576 domain-containing protein [Brevundimonas sp. 2R-24]|uniref:DUF3576 domain-containing protein n=1 Tax=Peiella sedimenti TaxID=3061083 RepID=A0ABT8SKS4_9CAUL|nr:DUF3576 domain-containing protein [Caulobacteraceae bacterium XZ-24]
MTFIRGLGLATVAVALTLGGCASRSNDAAGDDRGVFSRLLGRGGDDASAADVQSQAGIGVNGYLWRASLETLSFLPLESADPFGGVINYDWYANPEQPNERFKVAVFILDSRLRADALNITINKQARNAAGEWVDAAVSGQTETDLENAVLTRARQIRLSGQEG